VSTQAVTGVFATQQPDSTVIWLLLLSATCTPTHLPIWAVWANGTASLRALILSDNPGLSGNASSIKLPSSLQALHIANTNISGSFDAGWMSRQGPNFNCLVAYGAANLCGQLDGSMPCSLVNATLGTNLGEQGCQLHLDSRVLGSSHETCTSCTGASVCMLLCCCLPNC
jgi:hypothetical protein